MQNMLFKSVLKHKTDHFKAKNCILKCKINLFKILLCMHTWHGLFMTARTWGNFWARNLFWVPSLISTFILVNEEARSYCHLHFPQGGFVSIFSVCKKIPILADDQGLGDKLWTHINFYISFFLLRHECHFSRVVKDSPSHHHVQIYRGNLPTSLKAPSLNRQWQN